MYLLDTSAVSIATNPADARHCSYNGFIKSNNVLADQLFISAITIAEMEAGIQMKERRAPPPKPQDLAEVRMRVANAASLAAVLEVTRHVAREHAALKVAYAAKYAPNKLQSGALKGKPVELWHDTLAASVLQVQENDLWIAATAITHDLVLLSGDTDHRRMQAAEPRLKLHLF